MTLFANSLSNAFRQPARRTSSNPSLTRLPASILKTGLLIFWLGSGVLLSQAAHAALIGRALSDAPDIALLATDNPLQSAFSSSEDGFGRYQRGASVSIPAALLDKGAGDSLGLIREADTAPFFGVVDTINSDNLLPAIARWTFAVSGFQSLQLALGMAAMGDFESSDWFRWHYQFDNGPLLPVFAGLAEEAAAQSYTLSGGSTNLADPIAVEGTLLDNRFRRFSRNLVGTGQRLSLELSAVLNGGSEAAAFRDLTVSGVAPSRIPSSGTLPLLLVAFAGLWTIRRQQPTINPAVY